MNTNLSIMIAQLEKLQNLDIKSYIQAIIAIETNNYNQASLDSLYEEWLENDHPLLSELFDGLVTIL